MKTTRQQSTISFGASLEIQGLGRTDLNARPIVCQRLLCKEVLRDHGFVEYFAHKRETYGQDSCGDRVRGKSQSAANPIPMKPVTGLCVVEVKGIEPLAPCMQSRCSPAELHPHVERDR